MHRILVVDDEKELADLVEVYIKAKTIDGQIPVERVVPKLSKLSFCQKGRTSELATLRYREILHNLSREGLQER